MHSSPRLSRDALRWAALATALVILAGALALISPKFGYDVRVRDMPVFSAVALLSGAGALYLLLPALIRATAGTGEQELRLFWLVIAAGIAMRLVLLPSEPVLEDDYQRYLWDGAQTAAGFNPYAASPDEAMAAPPAASQLGRLAISSGKTLGRVNHSHLKTVYPPLAQAAFALAHWIGPWSLTVWRLVCLACDAVAVALLTLLLREIGRPILWSALYWWNPLAIKEIVNSAHMDVLLLPLILAALLLAVRGRGLSATASLVAAAGVKLWPALLLPLIWRPLAGRPARVAGLAAVSLTAAGLMAWPVLAGGLDGASGLVAYAKGWSTNSAYFPQFQSLVAWLMQAFDVAAANPALAARGLIGLVLIGLVLSLAYRPIADARDLIGRTGAVVALVFFAHAGPNSPGYYLWVTPFLPFFPLYGLLVLTMTLPLYYASFHFIARDTAEIFNGTLVWLVWLPAWALLLAHDLPRLVRRRVWIED